MRSFGPSSAGPTQTISGRAHLSAKPFRFGHARAHLQMVVFLPGPIGVGVDDVGRRDVVAGPEAHRERDPARAHRHGNLCPVAVRRGVGWLARRPFRASPSPFLDAVRLLRIERDVRHACRARGAPGVGRIRVRVRDRPGQHARRPSAPRSSCSTSSARTAPPTRSASTR